MFPVSVPFESCDESLEGSSVVGEESCEPESLCPDDEPLEPFEASSGDVCDESFDDDELSPEGAAEAPSSAEVSSGDVV